jgi:hypothetical protein
MSSSSPKEYGHLGGGVTSRLRIEIDEALDDPNDVLMSIEALGWSFRFALSSREDVARILAFLREHTGRLVFSELVVGSFHGHPVALIKDDEYGDRFWFRTYGDRHMVEFTLGADVLADFTDAVSQAIDDLQS